MLRTISAQRVATLIGPEFLDGDLPMYSGLAHSLRILIGDGRIPLETRLPSERALTDRLGVSRTTVTRAYADLCDHGFAESRRGSGTFTRIPVDRAGVLDRALAPRLGDESLLDLNCAAPSAPPGLAEAYAAALADLPAYLAGHGYFPAGLPQLQHAIAASYESQGLPTDPDQILITAGALSAAAIVAQTLAARGDTVLVESPVYPNATKALGHRDARLVALPVDPDGWDLDAIVPIVHNERARAAYLIPDFQNPTGHVMSTDQRAELAAALHRAGTVPIIDEAHRALALDGQVMPEPFGVHSAESISIGSASKAFWGGLRIGWIRVPSHLVAAVTQARLGLDLGAPVLEQLALTHLLRDAESAVEANRARLRHQRDALLDALATHLPHWRVRRPAGGLAVWCELPEARASALAAEAERLGVVVAPGPVFAVDPGLERFVRIPWARPAEDLVESVVRLEKAWALAEAGTSGQPRQRVRLA